MDRFKINKKLLPVKIHYFLLNGGHAGVITFVPIYAEQLGISASAVGVILAVISCLTVLTKTTFGGIVDHFQKIKQVLLFLIIADIAADLGINFIPRPYQQPVNVTGDNFLCSGGNSYIIDNNKHDCKFDFQNSTIGCQIDCSLCQYGSPFCAERNESKHQFTAPGLYTHLDHLNAVHSTLNSSILPPECLFKKDSVCSDSCFDGSENCRSIAGTNPPLQLWLLVVFVTIVYTAYGSIVSLSDAACYNALGDEPQNFGKQRMWGTVGWGIFGLLTGYLNQVFTGSSKVYSYSSGFYILVVLFVIDLFVITKLRLKNATVSKNICRDVGNLLVKPKILLFIIGIYGIGIVNGIARAYLFWYLRTTLNASQLILGCVSGIQCFFGEFPFFFFSGLIIAKLGHINTFTMSFIAYGVKFLSHSFLMNPWWALPVELLQGPCFGSFYTAMTSYSKLVSPTGTEATMQGIVSGTFEGLGVATGSLLGGLCISNFGGRQTFFWTGLVSLVVGLIHWMVHRIKDCQSKGEGTPSETSVIIA